MPDQGQHAIDGVQPSSAGAPGVSSDEPGDRGSEPSAGTASSDDDPTTTEQPSTLGSAVDMPQVGATLRLGTLIGPGALEPPANVTLYGAGMAISFEHAGQLQMLLADTWPDATQICRNSASLDDDAIARLPARLPASTNDAGGVPQLNVVSDAATPSAARPIALQRGGQALALGYGQLPMAAFSDGEHAYAFFARAEPARCDASTNRVECPRADGLDCAGPADAPLCVDPGSSQYDGSSAGELAASVQRIELAVQGDDPTQFSSALSWPSDKFASLTARTVAGWSGVTQGNDYSAGHGELLVWGRPGLGAEHGREAQLYLMTHALPLVRDDHGSLQFTPRYFAGSDRATGEPSWTGVQADAKPLALDGESGGSPHEELPITGQMAVSWLPAPIGKWVMLYGGDTTSSTLDGAGLRSTRAPGAIMLRFADQPWGPWSPPLPQLVPGKPALAGDGYGPGGLLYHPGCKDLGAQKCVRSDARQPHQGGAIAGCPFSQPELDPGRFSGVNIIDAYTRPDDAGGLDLIWNVSLWNPYAVALFSTQVLPAAADENSADELADVGGLERMSEWRNLPVLEGTRRYRQQSSHDRATGDTGDSSFPLSGFGNRDFNNFLCASKDAQLGGSQIAPFHFDQPQCDEDYVHGVVLSRFEGSGRLVRTWIGASSLLLAPADDEIVRVYVDDDPTPRVEQPLAAVLDGSAGEIFAPPFGAGSPLRMAWYYPIAFEHKLIVALDRLGDYDEYYFHCDVVYDDELAASGAPRASLRDRRRAQAQLEAVYHPAGVFPELAASQAIELAAGQTQSVELAGPATIAELRVRVAEPQLNGLSAVHVSVRWDDAADSAIDDLSLLELLASSQAPPERSTQALTSYGEAGERVLALKLPMPFASSAHFTFENRGTTAAAFELSLRGERALPPAPFGKLHVVRNETDAPTTQADLVSVDLQGRGRLVGVCAFLEGRPDPAGGIQYDPLNLLEGDVRVTTDGELALDGTGTEEYADDVFYFQDAPQASPFVQAWGLIDDVQRSPLGQANLCRWHVLGTEIDFDHSLQVSFELGGAGNPQTVARHHTVAYVYLL